MKKLKAFPAKEKLKDMEFITTRPAMGVPN